DVTFAWGPTAQIPTQPNVFTYTIAAEQGGYVLGAIAANLTANDVVGVVGPIEAGDAQRYVAGFEAGVAAERPEVSLLVRYTGSFLDASLAAEAATEHIGAGADFLTGAGPVAAGAAQVAIESEAAWLGNYVDQSTIDPANVVASQVYHWDVPLREILTDSSAGGSGRPVAGTLANGGITVAFNPSYPLDPAVAAKASELIASIVEGAISPPAN
ncbi:MAG: BMP family ABC transporter substrate-binding protein, partial [Acidimicrobiales bacterium]